MRLKNQTLLSKLNTNETFLNECFSSSNQPKQRKHHFMEQFSFNRWCKFIENYTVYFWRLYIRTDGTNRHKFVSSETEKKFKLGKYSNETEYWTKWTANADEKSILVTLSTNIMNKKNLNFLNYLSVITFSKNFCFFSSILFQFSSLLILLLRWNKTKQNNKQFKTTRHLSNALVRVPYFKPQLSNEPSKACFFFLV